MRGALLFIYIFSLGIGYTYACGQGKEVVREHEKLQWLRGHNLERAKIGVPALQWSQALYELSDNYARELAQSCSGLVHAKGLGDIGENLAGRWGGKPLDSLALVVEKQWIPEKQWYNYKKNKCQSGKQCLHYRQVVARRSTELGCSHHSCADPDSQAIRTYYVCNYSKHGNMSVGTTRPY